MSYSADRSWSDQFIPSIKDIVGPRLLNVSSDVVDRQQAADLVVLRGDGDITVACRIRRFGYADRFPDDVTIRSGRDTGAKTELAKIIEGFGSWFFYGHQSARGSAEIGLWWLLDLDAFRAHHFRGHRGRLMSNGDGTHFQVFEVGRFEGEPRILIDSSQQPRPRRVSVPDPPAPVGPDQLVLFRDMKRGRR